MANGKNSDIARCVRNEDLGRTARIDSRPIGPAVLSENRRIVNDLAITAVVTVPVTDVDWMSHDPAGAGQVRNGSDRKRQLGKPIEPSRLVLRRYRDRQQDHERDESEQKTLHDLPPSVYKMVCQMV